MKACGYVLVGCSGLLMSVGTVLGGSVLWAMAQLNFLFWTTELGIEFGSSLLIVAGCLLCLPACWIASIVPYHTKNIHPHSVLMAILMCSCVLMTAGLQSLAALSRELRAPAAVSSINSTMHRVLRCSPYDVHTNAAIDAMQKELQCCGVQSFRDWSYNLKSIPDSCCQRSRMPFLKRKKDLLPCVAAFTSGCLKPSIAVLRNYSYSMSILSFALVCVLTISLVATSFLMLSNVLEKESNNKMISCVTTLTSGQQPLHTYPLLIPPPPLAPSFTA